MSFLKRLFSLLLKLNCLLLTKILLECQKHSTILLETYIFIGLRCVIDLSTYFPVQSGGRIFNWSQPILFLSESALHNIYLFLKFSPVITDISDLGAEIWKRFVPLINIEHWIWVKKCGNKGQKTDKFTIIQYFSYSSLALFYIKITDSDGEGIHYSCIKLPILILLNIKPNLLL